MSLRNAASVSSFGSFVSHITDELQAENLFVLSHDCAELHPLGTTSDQVINDETVIDELLGGSTVRRDGKTFTPVMSRRFPLLVASGVKAPVDEIDQSHLIGPIAEFHRDFFDEIESRRRSRPFTPAAQLQWSLLPTRAAEVNGLKVAGSLHPAASVAGDAYDFAVSPSGALTVLAMDAMGHGVSATLSTALALATMRTVRRAGGTLEEQVRASDEAILDEYDGDRFVTMVALEFGGDAVLVINAGHEPIRRITDDNNVKTLHLSADPPLGLDGLSDYQAHRIAPLKPGEALVLLSDGAAEARDHNGVEFGERGINDALSALRGPAALQTADRLGRAVQRYIPGDLEDDLTTVVIEQRRL